MCDEEYNRYMFDTIYTNFEFEPCINFDLEVA